MTHTDSTIRTSSLKTIQVLTVVFEDEIKSYEIPGFRGAIMHKVGLDNILFHNHLGEGFRYKYPAIQYKRWGKHPCIICLGEGVTEMHKFFAKQDWRINISNRELQMRVDRLQIDSYDLKVYEEPFSYSIRNWLALNQHNWRDYQQLQSDSAREGYLKRKLVGNILSFAKGVDWHVDQPIEVNITEMEEPRTVKVKKVAVKAFNLSFTANVPLPNNIGLGKNVTLGYGVVRRR